MGLVAIERIRYNVFSGRWCSARYVTPPSPSPASVTGATRFYETGINALIHRIIMMPSQRNAMI
jgi:hypothetical protein